MEDKGVVKEFATWPKFSATSYFMVSRLARQGVRPRTVLDVGANVAQFAVALEKLFPGARVHSFVRALGCAEEPRKNRPYSICWVTTIKLSVWATTVADWLRSASLYRPARIVTLRSIDVRKIDHASAVRAYA
jgi:hypothetical protein